MNVEEPTMPSAIASSLSPMRESIDSRSKMNHRQDHDLFLSMPLWGGKKVEEDDEISLFDDIHNQFSAINLIDDSIAEVQQVEKESKMRTEMTRLFEMCLKAQDNKCDMKPSQSKESIRKLASLLETRLYKSAISFESYCDLSTLQSRMRVVLYHLKNQRQQKKRRKSSIKSQKRSHLLKHKMGSSQHARAEWLVHEIQQRKNLLAGQSCTSTKCQINNRGGGGGTSSSCSSQQQSLLLLLPQTVPFGESLPRPVRNLFFRTPIVDVLSKYPLERIETLSWEQLQHMMEQAEHHMEEFDSWRMLNEELLNTSTTKEATD